MATFIKPSISPTQYILKLNTLRESQPSYKLFLVIAYLTWLSPVDEKHGAGIWPDLETCANLSRLDYTACERNVTSLSL